MSTATASPNSKTDLKLPTISSNSRQQSGAKSVPNSTKLPTLTRLKSSDSDRSSASSVREAKSQPATLNIEGQRILSVLQEAQHKIEIINAVPIIPDKKTMIGFSEEEFQIIHGFRNQQIKFETMFEKVKNEHGNQSHSSSSNIDTHLDLLSPELKEEARLLKLSTRTLCRTMGIIPLTKLKPNNQEDDKSLSEFLKLWSQLNSLVEEKLQTTIEEDRKKQEQLSHVTAKERKATEEIHQLNQELERARNERSVEINKRNDTIKRLKDQLRDIKAVAEESANKLEINSKKKEEVDLNSYKEKENLLKPEIQKLRETLIETQKTNQEEEAALRKKKFKIETEVENWIHKYDQEMEEKQNEIEETTIIYKEEKAQLQELEERFSELKKEYDRIVEEKRIAVEEAKRKEEELQSQTRAATRIQALWRGYKSRKELAKKKKKTGSGKSKSAGKKK